MLINRVQHNKQVVSQNKTVSFKGGASQVVKTGLLKKAGNKVVDIVEKPVTYIAGSGFMNKLLDKTSEKMFNKHFMAANSFVLSSSYILFELKSKKIEEDRKKTLMVNLALGGILPTIGGYLINDKITKRVDKFIEKFGKANPDIPYKSMKKSVKAAQGIFVFAMMYRLICPLIATQMAEFSKHLGVKEEDGKKTFFFKMNNKK